MLLGLTSGLDSRLSQLSRVVLITTFSCVLASCNLFDKTCEEDDRDCIGPGPGLGANLGRECQISADCKEGLSCVSETCQVTGRTARGERCRLTAECGDADYCGSQRICLLAGNGVSGEDCEDTSACIHGLVCEGPNLGDLMEQTGVVTLNDLATLTGECTLGGNGEQGSPCQRLADCLAGLYCLEIEQAGLDKICTNISLPAHDGELPPIPEVWGGVVCEEPGEDDPKKAVFEVPRENVEGSDDFYALPFPNDIRHVDGHIDMNGHPVPPPELGVPFIERYAKVAGEDLTGFSTNAVAIFRFSHPYDFNSVKADDDNTMNENESTIRLIDISADSPEYNTARGIEWKTTEGALSTYVCPHWLGIKRPLGNPMRPSTTYVALVMNGVSPEGGGSFERDEDLDALLGNSKPGDAVLGDAWETYQPLRDWLEDTNQTGADILNAAVFTTQDPESIIRGLRERVVEDGVATVSQLRDCSQDERLEACESMEEGSDVVRGACLNSNTDAFTEIHARIRLPMFQKGTLPYGEPEDGGGIQLDSNGKPIIDAYREVCMAISVPKAAPPAGGYPVLIFSHGTGGSFTNAMTGSSKLAEDLAQADTPAVVVAIDLPMHGDRRGDSEEDPDGLFYNFLNPRAARDNVLQGSADLMGLVQWINQDEGIPLADSPTGSAIPFDGSRIVMMGHSQGSTHTALMISYEPMVSAVVLSGIGGHLTSSLLSKTSPVDIASVVPIGLQDPDDNFKLAAGEFNPALAIVQSVFDPVDPINYARHLHREPTAEAPTSLHTFVTYGLNDTFATENTQLAYGLAARFVLVTPVLRPPTQTIPMSSLESAGAPLSGNQNLGGEVRTIGMRQYTPTTERDGALIDGHFVAVAPGEQGRADVLRFLEQSLAGQTPQIGN